jgi:hypothetical protein
MPPKLSLAIAQEEARKRGGECLSTVYVNNITKMRWRCAKGHEWEAILGNIRGNGAWCPQCNSRTLKLSLRDAQQAAAERGGECLSTRYVNTNTKMRWRCAEGHEWEAILLSIRNHGTWCASCSLFKREKECRRWFEHFTGIGFPKLRPVWLGGLELDGYCESLNLAFEYQGEQHYRYVEYFHKTPEELEKQTERDFRKQTLCQGRGVILIQIPYWVSSLEKSVRQRLIEAGLVPRATGEERAPLGPDGTWALEDTDSPPASQQTENEGLKSDSQTVA